MLSQVHKAGSPANSASRANMQAEVLGHVGKEFSTAHPSDDLGISFCRFCPASAAYGFTNPGRVASRFQFCPLNGGASLGVFALLGVAASSTSRHWPTIPRLFRSWFRSAVKTYPDLVELRGIENLT